MTDPRAPKSRLLIMLVAMALASAAPVRAQQVATSFGELQGLVEAGETIYVTDTRGVTTKGKLVGLFASSLEVGVGGDGFPLRLAERDVNNVVAERVDSLWNGPLIGLASGAVPGLLIELAGRTEYEKFSGRAAVGLGAIGLIAGLLIDVLNGEKVTVYVHPAEARSSTVRVLPLLSNSGAGVQMSVGF